MSALTPERRAELRRLLADATNGPWEVGSENPETHGNWFGNLDPDLDGSSPVGDAWGPDAALIVAFRNNAEALLDRLDEMEDIARRMILDATDLLAKLHVTVAERDRLLTLCTAHEIAERAAEQQHAKVCAERDQLRVERDRLRVEHEAAETQEDFERKRAEQAEAHLRDLTSRLGFGDGITEPQADNDTIVRYWDEVHSDARDWNEHQLWLNDCAVAGCPDDEDCHEHNPDVILADERDAAWVEIARLRIEVDRLGRELTARGRRDLIRKGGGDA